MDELLNPNQIDNKRPGPTKNLDDLAYQTMPGGVPLRPEDMPKNQPLRSKPILTEITRPQPPTKLTPFSEPEKNTAASEGLPVESHAPSRKLIWGILGALAIIILGGLAYFMFFNKPAEPETPTLTTGLNEAFLRTYFQVTVCNDLSVCGDNADPDNDGLTNIQEFHATGNINPKNPDSDNDGLADGDEVFVFKTQPGVEFTSCAGEENSVACQYNDGSQIANDYDPLTPGIKMTAARKQQIESDGKIHKLHAPTTITLQALKAGQQNNQSGTQSQTHTVFIEGNLFNPLILDINVGDTVVWLNKDTNQHQIASNPHPTHTDLPDLISEPLAKDKTYNFTFTKTGTVRYHDHLNASSEAQIIVK